MKSSEIINHVGNIITGAECVFHLLTMDSLFACTVRSLGILGRTAGSVEAIFPMVTSSPIILGGLEVRLAEIPGDLGEGVVVAQGGVPVRATGILVAPHMLTRGM